MAVFIFVVLFISQLFSSKLTYKENSSSEIKTREDLALEKFRELMGDALYRDYMKSDVYLLRWLREKNFDLKGARKILDNALKWRKENNIDTILDEVIFEKDKLPYQIMNGSDNEGSMVAVAMLTKLDVRDIILSGKKEAIIRTFAQMWEVVETTILKRSGVIGNTPGEGVATDKGTFIIDADGYNFRQHACKPCIPVYLQMFEIMEYYYPGYAKHYFIINVPRIFSPLLELAKPIMSLHTKKSLQIFSANKKEWRKEIAKHIPVDRLKTVYGGILP